MERSVRKKNEVKKKKLKKKPRIKGEKITS